MCIPDTVRIPLLRQSVDEVTGQTGQSDKKNGVTDDFSHFIFDDSRQDGQYSHDTEDDPTNGVDEGGGFHEHECSRRDQTDDGEAQHTECLLEIGVALEAFVEPEIGFAHTEHDDQARKNQCERS